MTLRKADLHAYQKYSADFIVTHPVAALLLSCGLGKTVTTLTAVDELLFDRFEVHRVLVICPLRVGNVWKDEVQKWSHLKDLILSVAIGTEQQRIDALKARADIYIINRENVQWMVENTQFDFDMIVIDELSSFKNHQTKRFRSLMKVRPLAKRVVGLTGTPTANGLMDLWAEFRLLDMGQRLGRFIGRYRTEYFKPDKMNGQIIYSYKPLPGAEERIYDKISDITISMKATDHLEMPELIESNHTVCLTEDERKKYDDMRKELTLQLPDGEITAANAAALSNKLCQMANGSVYTDSGDMVKIHDEKIDALEDIIESMNGNPLLVAYWFKHDYDRITERLHKLHIPFAKLDTETSIRRWNSGEIPVALIHPASAGHGLNLQSGGNTLVWFGLTWSLELYQQTNARLWRQGQKSKTVIIQHIVTKGTIDEQILKVLKSKNKTQTALIDAVKANLEV